MIRAMLRHCVLVAIAGFSLACGSSGASGASSGAGSSASPARRDRSTISPQELRDSQASNLFEIVERLHPEWLSGRNASTIGGKSSSQANEVQVYVDTQRSGTTDLLRQLAPNVASSLRYYTPSEAQARFGTGNLNGAIQVITTSKP